MITEATMKIYNRQTTCNQTSFKHGNIFRKTVPELDVNS